VVISGDGGREMGWDGMERGKQWNLAAFYNILLLQNKRFKTNIAKY
jgi:hypothetical protein